MNFKVDPEIISGFVKEVESYLPKLAQSLEEFRANPESPDSLEEAYRMVHCIRGAGSTIGLMALSQMAQYQEDMLEQILSGQLRWSDEVAGVLASATARIGEYLHGITSGDLHEHAIVTELVKAFRRMRDLPESGDAEEIRNLLGASTSQEQVAEESARDFAEMEPEILSFETIEDQMPADEPARMESPAAAPEMVIQTLDEFQVDDDLWSAFQEEAAEHFEKLASGLAALEASDDVETLKTIRRPVHQLKGASGVVGMRATSKINASMQKVLDRIFEGEAKYTRDLLPLFQRAFEVVLESIGGKGTGANLADRAKEIQANFDEILSLPASPPAAPAVPPASSAAANGPRDQMDVGDDLLEAFHQEAEEHLHVIGELFRNMERESPNAEQIQAMRRAVHTFKGACGVVGLRLTSSVAHRMEDLLDAMYEGRTAYRADLAPLLFSTYDILTDAVANRGISSAQRDKVDALFAGYEAALAEAEPQASAEEPGAAEAAELALVPAPQEARKPAMPAAGAEPPQRKSAQFVRAPLERLDELVRLVSELVIHRSRFEQHLSGYVHEVNELQLSIERLSRISRKFQSDYEATALQEANRRAFTAIGRGFSPAGSAAADDFDALEFDRYTEFHLLSRDLAETTGDVSNAGSRLNDLIADFDSYLNRLSTLTGEVEDRLMRLRMLPLRHLSSRLHRTVRVTAERRNKLVNLVVDGEAVELDKTVLEEMAGPLDHILRNAVDHGIEPAALRRAAGKPERGTIYLRAYHEGTQVVLQIRDDGGGLDVRRLREAAVAMGYISPEDAPNLSDQELYGIIFLPGFSTASEVSEVSGRGVGLDVVKATVNKMKGTLSIQSERGKGTSFTIRLPMTLALTRVVLVRSGLETYA
ncbi:MAG: Hpt domain-containing protein, partial [Bryobacterales bacterium]|nr:Hpt domain-containing protein [Bryobacterales bacterium]